MVRGAVSDHPRARCFFLKPSLTSSFFQTYIFEVVEVVPQPGRPQSKYKLKLLCHDPCKGAVTAISDINGYLVSATAQKVSPYFHQLRLASETRT